jgi:hypothetical protein
LWKSRPRDESDADYFSLEYLYEVVKLMVDELDRYSQGVYEGWRPGGNQPVSRGRITPGRRHVYTGVARGTMRVKGRHCSEADRLPNYAV